MIRNRVCGEEEGESRRSRDQEEEIRTKSVVQSVLCRDVSLIVYNYRVRSGLSVLFDESQRCERERREMNGGLSVARVLA